MIVSRRVRGRWAGFNVMYFLEQDQRMCERSGAMGLQSWGFRYEINENVRPVRLSVQASCIISEMQTSYA
jgi:hypothetical protein